MRDGKVLRVGESPLRFGIRAVHHGPDSLNKETQGWRLAMQLILESLADAKELLSPHEFEVFELVGQGLTLDEIAAKRFVSVKTVSTQLGRAKDKLFISNLTKLRMVACRLVYLEELKAKGKLT